MMIDIAPETACDFCGKTVQSGGWNYPCDVSRDKLHWTAAQLQDAQRETAETMAQYTRRAAYELERAAKAIEALPPRLRRKVVRAQPDLDPHLLRNEAERARDILHVGGLLDV